MKSAAISMWLSQTLPARTRITFGASLASVQLGAFPNRRTLCKGHGTLPDTRLKNPSCPPCLGTGLSTISHGLCETCGGWGRLPIEPANEAPKVILVRAGKVWDSHMEMAALFMELQGELASEGTPWKG